MPRRKRRFSLDVLDEIVEDLRLSSLTESPPTLRGHAFRYTLVLPRLSQTGEEVFTGQILRTLHELLARRFGGILTSSDIPQPTWYGTYLPESHRDPVKDFHVILYVYTRPIDAADRFFRLLKSLLKKEGVQDEVLVEKVPVWLLGDAEHGD